MTGLRKEIAKHVVINIMDTLGEDDFVTVLTFSDETKPLVDCFTDSEGEAELVQATNENIAVFTEHINNIETMEIANFTSALTAAFTLLERYRTKKVSNLVHLQNRWKYVKIFEFKQFQVKQLQFVVHFCNKKFLWLVRDRLGPHSLSKVNGAN